MLSAPLLGITDNNVVDKDGVSGLHSSAYNTTAVSMEIVNGLILVKAEVGGVYGDYILDTGASSILVNQEVKNSNLVLSYFDHDLKAKKVNVKSIYIGSARHKVNEVLAVDLSNIENKIKRPIAGIIGSQVLTQYNVVVDYEGGEVVLMDQRQRDLNFLAHDYKITSLPFTLTDYNIISVNITVDGKDQNYIFDTGASMNVSLKDHSNLVGSNHTISLNGVKIKDVPFFKDQENHLPQWLNDSFDGILSPYSLSAKKVIVDFSNQRIHFFFQEEKQS